jgi:hypothetical protein
MTSVITMALVAGVLFAVAMLAKHMPRFGLALGVVFTAVPVIQWLTLDRTLFGSGFGTLLLIIYAGLGLICLAIGVSLISKSVRTLRGKDVTLHETADEIVDVATDRDPSRGGTSDNIADILDTIVDPGGRRSWDNTHIATKLVFYFLVICFVIWLFNH